jgi:hypothetical protein
MQRTSVATAERPFRLTPLPDPTASMFEPRRFIQAGAEPALLGIVGGNETLRAVVGKSQQRALCVKWRRCTGTLADSLK